MIELPPEVEAQLPQSIKDIRQFGERIAKERDL